MENLKQRLFTGWTFIRLFYVLVGSAIIINSVESQQWLSILFGGYFASMGLFRFGCAAGACYNGSCKTEAVPKENRS